jgi:hypothetical protein
VNYFVEIRTGVSLPVMISAGEWKLKARVATTVSLGFDRLHSKVTGAHSVFVLCDLSPLLVVSQNNNNPIGLIVIRAASLR